jgi:hypothetical protein
MIKWIKLQVEALKFGRKVGAELGCQYPMADKREIQFRILVAWHDHLVRTGRSSLVKDPKAFKNLREGLEKIDAIRAQQVIQGMSQLMNKAVN